MTTSKDYEKFTTHDLRNQCKGRGVKVPRNATKTQLVAALKKADAEKADPDDFGNLPPKKAAPEDFEPPTPPPPAATAPQVKIPPDPPNPEDLPPEPEIWVLQNDIEFPVNGLPTKLWAGAELSSNEYDIEKIKSAGGVPIRKRVFENSKLPQKD